VNRCGISRRDKESRLFYEIEKISDEYVYYLVSPEIIVEYGGRLDSEINIGIDFNLAPMI
jgi:hypothetical protein